MSLIKLGDRGALVKKLQESLNSLPGYKLTVTQVFDAATDNAVRVFQRRHNLTVDGKVGDGETWPAIAHDLAAIKPAAPLAKPSVLSSIVAAITPTPKPKTIATAPAGNRLPSGTTPVNPGFLIKPVAGWRGTVGRGLTREEFREHVDAVKFDAWKPSFIVLHNTGAPTMKQWDSHDVVDRIKNMTADYRSKGWRAGPHLFIDHTYIWLFTPLDAQGTHSPSWNSISWGVEMVGDYDSEPFDSGKGVEVRNNAAFALAVLSARRGIDPRTMRLHKEDKATTHACPGKHVDKTDMIARVEEEMARLTPGDHAPSAVS